MNNKHIIVAARVLSIIFTPFYLPLLGMIVLFFFTYLSMLPTAYKLIVLTMVYLFTILIPTITIHLYRRYQGWSLLQLGIKERRMMPYIISILSYFLCLYLMEMFHLPHFMGSILMAALIIQVVCAVINVWWKVSTHTAAIGGVAGALIAFSELFFFNPVGWFCVVVLLGGVLGSCRMVLRQHTLSQVVAGFCIGLMAAYIVISKI